MVWRAMTWVDAENKKRYSRRPAACSTAPGTKLSHCHPHGFSITTGDTVRVLEFLSVETCQRINGAAGGKWDNDAHRSEGIGLAPRRKARDGGQHRPRLRTDARTCGGEVSYVPSQTRVKARARRPRALLRFVANGFQFVNARQPPATKAAAEINGDFGTARGSSASRLDQVAHPQKRVWPDLGPPTISNAWTAIEGQATSPPVCCNVPISAYTS